MNRIVWAAGLGLVLGVSSAGCATSHQEQQRALAHQQNSDNAAANGQYGIAGSEERKAEEAHHKAAVKAIDEGKPIPPQTKAGDKPSNDN
jgi:hypothetical protein